MRKRINCLLIMTFTCSINIAQINFVVKDTPIVTNKDVYAYLHSTSPVYISSDIDKQNILFRRKVSYGTSLLNFGNVLLPGLFRFRFQAEKTDATNKIDSTIFYLIYPSPPDPNQMKRSLVQPIRLIENTSTFAYMIDSLFAPNTNTLNKSLDSVMKNYDSICNCRADSLFAYPRKDSFNAVIFFTSDKPNIVFTLEGDSLSESEKIETEDVFSLLKDIIMLSNLHDTVANKLNSLLDTIEAKKQYRIVVVRDMFKYLVAYHFGLESENLCNTAKLVSSNDYFRQSILLVKLKKMSNGLQKIEISKKTEAEINVNKGMVLVSKPNKSGKEDNSPVDILAVDKPYQFSSLALDPMTNTLYTIQEKYPHVLYTFKKSLVQTQTKSLTTSTYVKLDASIGKKENATEMEIEGACFFKNHLFFTDEKSNKIYSYSLKDNRSMLLDSISYQNKDTDYGLEGIAVDEENNILYVLREKNLDKTSSTIYWFKIIPDSKNEKFRLEQQGSVLIQQDHGVRYSDLFYFEKNIYAIRSRKDQLYKIDCIPVADIQKSQKLTATDFEVKDVKKEADSSNIEGLVVDRDFYYLISDNCKGGRDCQDVKKTLLIKIPR